MSIWLGTNELVAEQITLRPSPLDDAEQLAQVVDTPNPTAGPAAHPPTSRRRGTGSRSPWPTPNTRRLRRRRQLHRPHPRLHQLLRDRRGQPVDVDRLHLLRRRCPGHDGQPDRQVPPPQARVRGLWCGTVVWHTHESNAQSRAAIVKLGATFRGSAASTGGSGRAERRGARMADDGAVRDDRRRLACCPRDLAGADVPHVLTRSVTLHYRHGVFSDLTPSAWLSRPVEDTPDDVIPTRRVIDNFSCGNSNAVTCERRNSSAEFPSFSPLCAQPSPPSAHIVHRQSTTLCTAPVEWAARQRLMSPEVFLADRVTTDRGPESSGHEGSGSRRNSRDRPDVSPARSTRGLARGS